MGPHDHAQTGSPLLTTSTVPPPGEIEVLGLVSGVSVISRDLVRDFGATLRNTIGGELKTYTGLVEKAFAQAHDRLRDNAVRLGADGVFGIQVGCPEMTAGAATVLLVGTAYRIIRKEREKRPPQE